jgi:hypothetical protein
MRKGGAAKGGRRCYRGKAAELQWVGGGASMKRRQSCKVRPAVLPWNGSGAAKGGWQCFQGTAAELQRAAGGAYEEQRRSCKGWPTVLLRNIGEAAKGGQRCFHGKAAELQRDDSGAASQRCVAASVKVHDSSASRPVGNHKRKV